MKHLIRFLLLITLFVVCILFLDIDNKIPIIIGAVLGVSAAYLIATLLMKNKPK